MNYTLRFSPSSGQVDCLYTDAVELSALGRLNIVRATEILFNSTSQKWETRDASTSEVLFSHRSRRVCLRWENENLQPGKPRFPEQLPHPKT